SLLFLSLLIQGRCVASAAGQAPDLLDQTRGVVVPGVRTAGLAGLSAEFLRQSGAVPQTPETIRKLGQVAGIEEQPALAFYQDFGDLAHAAGHDRPSGGHVFE